jgi:hypothetical protein
MCRQIVAFFVKNVLDFTIFYWNKPVCCKNPKMRQI